MNKQLALRTILGVFIGVVGGIAPFAVTGDFTVSFTRTHIEQGSLLASMVHTTLGRTGRTHLLGHDPKNVYAGNSAESPLGRH